MATANGPDDPLAGLVNHFRILDHPIVTVRLGAALDALNDSLGRLQALRDHGLDAVHGVDAVFTFAVDGVKPLVSPNDLLRVAQVDAAQGVGAAVLNDVSQRVEDALRLFHGLREFLLEADRLLADAALEEALAEAEGPEGAPFDRDARPGRRGPYEGFTPPLPNSAPEGAEEQSDG